MLLLLHLYTSHGGCGSYITTAYVVGTSLKNDLSSKCLDMLTWKHLGHMWSLTSVFVIFNGLVDIKGKRMLSTRYCHCKISGHSRDIRNTTVENTMCFIYPNFLHSIKIKHFIYFTCIEILGYYFLYKGGV